MKRILLLLTLINFCVVASAMGQAKSIQINSSAKSQSISIYETDVSIRNRSIKRNLAINYPHQLKTPQIASGVIENSIGLTEYDLQTNGSISNRLIKHNDGTISATWTMLPPGGASSSRGTGYNYFNGTTWAPAPTVRIEPTNRTGFTNIVVTSSGREMAIASSSTAPGMLITSRAQKGIGSWTEDATVLGAAGNDSWSKAISGGANGETVHALWNDNLSGANGQYSSVYYSRSLDGGVTWPILRQVLPELDSTHYRGFGGDSYSIDTQGDTVVFVIGSFTTDLVLMRSTDNGNTWNAKVIQPFFKSLYNDAIDSFPDLNGDSKSDYIQGTSGDAHVMIDNLGMTHVWWSNVLLSDTSASAPISFFPNSIDGLLYWNDGFAIGQAPDTIAYALDGVNGNGILDIPAIITSNGYANGMGFYRGSITQMPSSGVDLNNIIYVSYQSFCEDCDTSVWNVGHKHVYLIKSTDQGANWSTPVDIDETQDAIYQENVFACLAKKVDPTCIHVIFQRDAQPGTLNQSGWGTTPSEIVYACVDPMFVGINKVKESISYNYLSQNTPNPVEGKTTINYTIAANASVVSFTVTDVLGKVVYTENKGTVNAGTYSLVLDTEAMNSGVYFYSLTVNNQKETKKMMVK
ncbi:MAG TPA: T9SS type A sorting domain-containing protein [Bacteroidia bacterium]|nr:T9SS type A sorting domain-containing protein [Bacteroidia bacterium]HRH09850.1 T9SS type A sorting domain-containing protein [Bacteroidia bacterium]